MKGATCAVEGTGNKNVRVTTNPRTVAAGFSHRREWGEVSYSNFQASNTQNKRFGLKRDCCVWSLWEHCQAKEIGSGVVWPHISNSEFLPSVPKEGEVSVVRAERASRDRQAFQDLPVLTFSTI